MRTLSEMRDKIRRFVHDYDAGVSNAEYTDTILDDHLTDAIQMFNDQLLSHPLGQRILRVASPPITMVDSQALYRTPDKCLMLDYLEARLHSTLYASLATGTVSNTSFTGTGTAWDAVTAGIIVLFLDGRRYLVRGIDLSGCSDMDGVATALQTAIQSETGCTGYTVTWDATTSKFTFSAYDTIAELESATDWMVAATETDLSSSTYLNAVRGAGTVTISTSSTSWKPVTHNDLPIGTYQKHTYGEALMANYQTAVGHPECYDMHVDGYVRVYPAPDSTTRLLRFWYFRELALPSDDTYKMFDLPTGVDRCLEYLATTLLAEEDAEDPTVAIKFARRYERQFDILVSGRAKGQMRKRRSIHITGS